MSKSANPGELRTPVRFYRVERELDAEGNTTDEREINVFGEGVAVKCKWVNAHGTEVFEGMRLDVREPATLTARYSPLINGTLILYREGDARPYEIISVDDVEDRHRWMEIKVRRKGAAR